MSDEELRYICYRNGYYSKFMCFAHFCILLSTVVPALPLYFDFTFLLSSFPLSLLDYSLTPLVGSMSNYTAPNTTRVGTDLSCPVFSRYDRCNVTVTEGNCDDRGGPLFLTCIRSKYIVQFLFEILTIKIYCHL